MTVSTTDSELAMSSGPERDDETPTWSPWVVALWAALPVIVAVVAIAVLLRVHEDTNAGLGVIASLPWPYFVCVAVVIASFLWLLSRTSELRAPLGRGTPLVLALHIISLVVLLHGAAALIEDSPRFVTAWLHAGFTNHILQDHNTLPRLDARFSWPGFFAGAAALLGASGMHSAVSLIRWAPVVAVVLYLLPIYTIARHTTRSKRVAWLALLIFVLIDWVGQDYFAPETLGFLLYLIVVALVVVIFQHGARPLLLVRRVVAALTADRDVDAPDERVSNAAKYAVVAVLSLIVLAQAVSHQLSPVATIITLAVLALIGRTRLRAFPVFTAVVAVVWVSLAATVYWVGHLNQIAGSVGRVGTTLTANVSNRIQGNNADHLFVVRLRTVFAGVAWGLAFVSGVYLWVKRRLPITVFVLAFVPFLIILAQSYGGEALLRVFLFSSPFTAILIALAARPLLESWRRVIALALVMFVAVPAFTIAHFGNEEFEAIRPGEVAAVQKLWQIAPEHSVVVSVTADLPWRFERINYYSYRANLQFFEVGTVPALQFLMSRFTETKRSYLIITRGGLNYSEAYYGLKPGWFNPVRAKLTPANGFRLEYRNSDATIYSYLNR